VFAKFVAKEFSKGNNIWGRVSVPRVANTTGSAGSPGLLADLTRREWKLAVVVRPRHGQAWLAWVRPVGSLACGLS